MTKIILAAIVSAVIGGLSYYVLAYPPVVLKRDTAAALTSFSQAVATKNREAIGDALELLLTEDAKIKLEVHFLAIGNQKPAVVQDFNREQFTSFIDNILYPLTDYMYEARLTTFALAEDRASAQVAFTSKEWADGANLYGGVSINMRYSSETQCEGTVTFAPSPRLKQALCRVQFRSIPKPGEANKLRNIEGAREMLLNP
jgi:hypothetical protein